MMRKGPAIALIALLLAGFGATSHARQPAGVAHRGALDAVAAPATSAAPAHVPVPVPDDAARTAFQSRSSGLILLVTGTVERILADDRHGSPHQRFIIRSPGGISLLVAHNLALAPRLQGLAVGDTVAVLGEYEWNDKGGVMHWTHADPQRKHPAGYIEWRGRRYQ